MECAPPTVRVRHSVDELVAPGYSTPHYGTLEEQKSFKIGGFFKTCGDVLEKAFCVVC